MPPYWAASLGRRSCSSQISIRLHSGGCMQSEKDWLPGCHPFAMVLSSWAMLLAASRFYWLCAGESVHWGACPLRACPSGTCPWFFLASDHQSCSAAPLSQRDPRQAYTPACSSPVPLEISKFRSERNVPSEICRVLAARESARETTFRRQRERATLSLAPSFALFRALALALAQ